MTMIAINNDEQQNYPMITRSLRNTAAGLYRKTSKTKQITFKKNNKESFNQQEQLEIEDYDITSVPNDFNVATIFSQIEKGSLKIPPFQRNYVWDIKRASKLIESILRGLPIPQIFLYETEKKEYLVIDGQQRLMSIYYFMKMMFPVKEKRAELRKQCDSGHVSEKLLQNDTYFKSFKLKLPDNVLGKPNKFKNLTYETLSEIDKETFELSPIRCVVIKQNKIHADDSCVFEIFHRLNSGGINLHPQEIRMSLYYSRFFETLSNLNNQPEWRRLFCLENPEFHTKDIETILRGFALLEWGDKYTPSLIKFLNNYSKKSQSNTDEENNYIKCLFLSFLQATKKLPKNAFIRNDKFNLTLFESVFVATCTNAFKTKTIVTNSIDYDKIMELSTDSVFLEAAQKNTTSTVNVKKRILRAIQILNT